MNYPFVIFVSIIYIIIDIGVFIALNYFDVADFRQFGRFFCYFNFLVALAVMLYAILGMVFGY
ncbi:MAG: hypothetical protein WCV92_01605 [Candidatus Buchananbacteria bacterium]